MKRRVLRRLFPSVLILSLALLVTPLVASDAETVFREHSDRWLNGFYGLLVDNQDLTEDQVEVIWEATRAGAPAELSRARKSADSSPIVGVVAKATQHFSRDQLGRLFSGMGETQDFLVEIGALATPYCNCTTLNQPCNTIPGTCKVGCISWEQESEDGVGAEDKTAYVGICSG